MTRRQVKSKEAQKTDPSYRGTLSANATSSPAPLLDYWGQHISTMADENFGRMYFNFKDLTHPPFPGRSSARVLWVVALCYLAAIILSLLGAIMQIFFSIPLFAPVASFALLGALGMGIVLQFVRIWPVMIPADEYWLRLRPVKYPLEFLKQEAAKGYKIHRIRPYESVRPYRKNVPLTCDLSQVPVATAANIPLQMTGFLEFRFDPTFTPRERYIELMNESDAELEHRLISGLFDALHEIIQMTIQQYGVNALWTHGIPALTERTARFFQEVASQGFFIAKDSSVVYFDLPHDVAEAHLKEWAEQANARASTLKLEAFVDALNNTNSPEAAMLYRLTDNHARLRMTLRDAHLIDQALSPDKLSHADSGQWVNLLTEGDIVQGFARRKPRKYDHHAPSVDGTATPPLRSDKEDSDDETQGKRGTRRPSMFD